MNRLSPLIVRRVGPRAAAAAMTWQEEPAIQAGVEKNFEDLKLFATGWVGGLIFFGTFFS